SVAGFSPLQAGLLVSVAALGSLPSALLGGSILHQIPKGGHPHGDHAGEPGLLGKFFIWFNHRFERTSNRLRHRVDR
ncbi:hypothetical protein, partial [Mycobacterium tuberculosis]|uniref:hypothetical protein n=1 Tax=Mycobacterium tuberculosis TaxID=1773 RepID=UPI0012607803